MPLINVPDVLHSQLKAHALEAGVTMTTILRVALEAYFASPTPIPRTRKWFVKMYLWENEHLENESSVAGIETTGELPALAESFVGVPGVASVVHADLPRLRQVLARTQSASARLYNEDHTMLLQIDVYRERPEDALETLKPTRSLRIPLTP